MIIGIVYYDDDPEKKVFRQVFPEESDPPDILDDPKWITDYLDPARKAVLVKIDIEDRENWNLEGLP